MDLSFCGYTEIKNTNLSITKKIKIKQNPPKNVDATLKIK